MAEYNAGDAKLRIVPDASGFQKELESKLTAMKVDFTVKVNVALAQASADMARFREQENAKVINQRVNPQFSRASAEMGAWRAEQRAIPVNIPVNVDRSSAAAAGAAAGAAASSAFAKEFAKISSQVGQLFGSVVDVGKAVGLTGLIANIPAAVTAVASLGQALGQLSGAALVVPGAIATATASIGTLAIGLSGISDAYTAVTAAAEESGTGQAEHARAATSATQSLRNAVVDEAQAQKDVATARKDALNQLQDLNLELRGGQISEAQAVNDLAKARRDLAKGGFKDALDRRDAELRVESAEQRRIEAHNRLIDTADKKADADAKGVEGSDLVVAANERVVRSNQAVAAATQSLADATGTSVAAADKAADALAKLSPQAAEFVNTLVGLKPKWEDLKKTVSGNLFDGASVSFTQFVDNVLPGLKTGMGSIATAWNSNIKQLLSSLGSTNSKGLLDRILGNTAEAQNNFTKAIDPLVRGIGTLTAAGSDAIPRLATAIGSVAERFANFIEAADKDGRLDKWIDAGLTGFANLGNILLNIGKMFFSINTALGGPGLLAKFKEVTDKAATFLGSFEGQSKLKQFFAEGREEMDKLKPIISNLIETLPAIWQGVKNAWDIVAPILTTFTNMLKDSPGLIQGVVTAFAAWSTISPIIKGVNTGLGLFQLLLGGGGAAGGAAGGVGGLLARLGLGGAGAAGATGAAGAGGAALGPILAALGIGVGGAFAGAAGTRDIVQNWGGSADIPSGAGSLDANQRAYDEAHKPKPAPASDGLLGDTPAPAAQPGANVDLKTAIEAWENDNNVAPGAVLSAEQNASLTAWLHAQGLQGFESGGPAGAGLAVLHPNEYVLSAKAAKYPMSLKNALNEGKLPLNSLPHFETGGPYKQGPAPTDPIAPAPSGGGIPSIFNDVITGIQAPINNAIQVAQQAGAAPGGAPGGGATPAAGPGGGLFSGGLGSPAWAGAPAAAGPPVLGPPSPPLPGLPFAPGGILGGQNGPLRPGLPPPGPDVTLTAPLVPTKPDPAPPAAPPLVPSTATPAPDPNAHAGTGAAPGPAATPFTPTTGTPDYSNPYLDNGAAAPPDLLHQWLPWLPRDGQPIDAEAIMNGMPDKIKPVNIANQFGQILLGGVLGFFGLDTSILSPSNPYNQGIQKTAGFFAGQFGTPGSGTDGGLPAGVKVDADGNPFSIGASPTGTGPALQNPSSKVPGAFGDSPPTITGAVARGLGNPALYATSGPNAYQVPDWATKLAAQFGLKASTYSDGDTLHEAGYAFDFNPNGGPSDPQGAAKMDAFAAYVAQNLSGQTLQLIHRDAATGQEWRVAGGKKVGPGTVAPTYFDANMAGHADHVHWATDIAPLFAQDDSTTAAALAGLSPGERNAILYPQSGGVGQAGGRQAGGANGTLKSAAYQAYLAAGMPPNEWDAFDQLIQHESGWDPTAQNPGSTAYGLGQFLDTTWAAVGGTKSADPMAQLPLIFAYLKQRSDYHGSPAAAWSLWQSRSPHWYASGGGVDTIPAMLTPGEHVLTTGDVKAMGGQGGVYDFRRRLHMEYGGAAAMPMANPVVPIKPTPIVRPPDANVKIAPSVPRPAPPRPAPPRPVAPAAPSAPRAPTGPAPGGPAAGPAQGPPNAPPTGAAPGVGAPAGPPTGMPAPEQESPTAQSDQPLPASGPDPTAPAPEDYDHNLDAINTGIDSGAQAIGQAVSTAIGIAGSSGMTPGVGAIGPYVAGLIQQGGKIAKNVVNIGSSFLVGNVAPGTQDNAYGDRLAPEQKTPQSAETDGGRQYVFNGIDSRNVVDEIRLKDRQDQQAVLARW